MHDLTLTETVKSTINVALRTVGRLHGRQGLNEDMFVALYSDRNVQVAGWMCSASAVQSSWRRSMNDMTPCFLIGAKCRPTY